MLYNPPERYITHGWTFPTAPPIPSVMWEADDSRKVSFAHAYMTICAGWFAQ